MDKLEVVVAGVKLKYCATNDLLDQVMTAGCLMREIGLSDGHLAEINAIITELLSRKIKKEIRYQLDIIKIFVDNTINQLWKTV